MTPEELDEKDAEEMPSAEAEDDEDSEFEDDDDQEDAALPDDEEDGDQASLEELIAQRAAGRKAADESEDDGDIMALASERDEPVLEALPTKVAPIREQKEFVCKSCYLVKPRVQMADTKREYCRDCV
ncbi:MAG: DUF4193 family protein [Actinomycetota bacterium]|nr:DUF4193 family protein [Actinomycetota bacterium]